MPSLADIEHAPLPVAAPPWDRPGRVVTAVPETWRFLAGADDRARCEAVLVFAGLDLAEFQLEVTALQQPSPWTGVSALVTVACRRARVSRTYAVRGNDTRWLLELWADVQSGDYAPAASRGCVSAPNSARTPPDTSIAPATNQKAA